MEELPIVRHTSLAIRPQTTVSSTSCKIILTRTSLKSSSAVISQTGTLNGDRNYYLPFGGKRGTTSFNGLTTKRFTGQYHEASLPGGEGLSYYGSRWYDAKLGRFLSADTVVPGPGNPQAFNRYSYVLNRPTGLVDPSGHEPIGCYSSSGGQCYNQGGKPVASGGGSVSMPAYTNHGGCLICHAQTSAWDAGIHRWLTPGQMDQVADMMQARQQQGIEAGLQGAFLAFMLMEAGVLPSDEGSGELARDFGRTPSERLTPRMNVYPAAVDELPEGLPQMTLSGHGGWNVEDGLFTVPEGTWVVTYSPTGAKLANTLGRKIDVLEPPDGVWRQVYGPGSVMPNYTLDRIPQSWIAGNPVTVDEATNISELVSANQGIVHWSACTACNVTTPWSNYTFFETGPRISQGTSSYYLQLWAGPQ